MSKNKFQINEDGTVTFRISEVGDRSRTTLQGPFRVKGSLSPYDELASGRDMRQLLGAEAVSATDHEVNLAYALSQLRHRIVESPSFWLEASRESFGGAELDHNIILKVLNMAIEAEVTSRKNLRNEAKRRLKDMEASLEKYDKEEEKEDADE
jgi:hypothetical protein